MLRAEQEFEEKEGIWKTLLCLLKKDPKISVDSAMKVNEKEVAITFELFSKNKANLFCVRNNRILIPIGLKCYSNFPMTLVRLKRHCLKT